MLGWDVVELHVNVVVRRVGEDDAEDVY